MHVPGAVPSGPQSPQAAPELDGSVLGARIRELREAAGLSLRQTASRSGLSAGFLSQVERGLSNIALTNLRSVAAVLDVPVSDLFAGSAGSVGSADPAGPDSTGPDPDLVVFTLTRAASQPTRVVSGGTHYELLSARVPGLVLEPMIVHIHPGSPRDPVSEHAGEEFAYVLSGELLYEVAGTEHRLFAGDSLHLRSSTPHRLFNDTDTTTVVVSVVTPRLV